VKREELGVRGKGTGFAVSQPAKTISLRQKFDSLYGLDKRRTSCRMLKKVASKAAVSEEAMRTPSCTLSL
jgi:hypothetical protein